MNFPCSHPLKAAIFCRFKRDFTHHSRNFSSDHTEDAGLAEDAGKTCKAGDCEFDACLNKTCPEPKVCNEQGICISETGANILYELVGGNDIVDDNGESSVTAAPRLNGVTASAISATATPSSRFRLYKEGELNRLIVSKSPSPKYNCEGDFLFRIVYLGKHSVGERLTCTFTQI